MRCTPSTWPASEVATFYARHERALRVSAGPAAVDGRLQGAASVTVADLANPADHRPVPAPFELFGPGDVQRLAAGAVTRRFPVPGASDAEETKLALVELSSPDLPWRYTPFATVGTTLRPWLVLVVGHRAPGEVTVRPDGRVTLGVLTQGAHVLSTSWLWAHVHEVGTTKIARILSPLDLGVDQEYVACLVPAFRPDGSDAWDGAETVTVDCYDSWTFRTGPQGDFPDLAGRLHKADLAAIEAAGGKPFGRADVTYRPRARGAPAVVLATAGALRLPRPAAEGPDPADAPPPPEVSAEVAALSQRIVTTDGRAVVTAPRYDAPFSDGSDPAPVGWVAQLRDDPRARGAAGLGAWNAIEWQDRIALAAATKAGDLTIAADRIRHVALGIEASRSLWRRRVPTAPVERLAVLAPVLGRLPTTTGGAALGALVGRTAQLGPALLSSAARRVLRPGPARTALAEPGAGALARVLEAANECPADAVDPADILEGEGGDPERATKEAIWTAADGDEDLAARVLEHLDRVPGVAALAAALRAMAPGRDGRPDPEAVAVFLDTWEFDRSVPPLLSWPGWMEQAAPPRPCRPLDLGVLAGVVSDAVDPTVARPPAAERVLATLPGISTLGPVELEPELDLPLWSFLATRAPDWLLPGAGDLQQHAVVALSTNPAFVQALLVGANAQTTAELRWRNLPLVTRWSPLRKFWQRALDEYDVLPVKGWRSDEVLGSPVLAVPGRGEEAVVVLRTPLFRRYPATVIYLYLADGDFTAPAAGAPLALPERKDPTFTGTIGDDITFFGFPVPPADLATHWLVLEEPATGYRFYAAARHPAPPGEPDSTAAMYAFNRFAPPVRVLIGPLL